MKKTVLTLAIEKIDSDIANALSTMPLNTPFIEYLKELREFMTTLVATEANQYQTMYGYKTTSEGQNITSAKVVFNTEFQQYGK